MDLRPKLADDFLDAIFADPYWDAVPPTEQEALRADWKVQILDQFISHSVPCKEGCWVSCPHDEPIQAFLAKYPVHEDAIAFVIEAAKRRWPEAEFSLELYSDPEAGHVVYEGQHLVFAIQTGLDFYGPDKSYPENSPYDAASQEWDNWLVSDEIFNRMKPAHDVGFRTELRWKHDDEEEE